MDKQLLTELIQEVIEEGKGSQTNFIRQRKAKNKKKARERELRQKSEEELLKIALDEGITVVDIQDDDSFNLEDEMIDDIMASENETSEVEDE